jgi:hypothetical protein
VSRGGGVEDDAIVLFWGEGDEVREPVEELWRSSTCNGCFCENSHGFQKLLTTSGFKLEKSRVGAARFDGR